MLGWLLRFLLLAIVVRLAWRFFLGMLDGHTQPSRPSPVQPTGPMPLVKDPQCGTHVARERAIRGDIGNQVFYFCSDACRDTYLTAASRERRG